MALYPPLFFPLFFFPAGPLYRRPLADECLALASAEGRVLLRSSGERSEVMAMRVLQTCSDAFAAAALGEGQADQREGTFILLLALLVQKYMQDEASSNLSTLR